VIASGGGGLENHQSILMRNSRGERRNEQLNTWNGSYRSPLESGKLPWNYAMLARASGDQVRIAISRLARACRLTLVGRT